jgi:hypothetical protein
MVPTLRRRTVALATRDSALYAELAAGVRDRRIPSVSLFPGDRIPAPVSIVLTTPEEVHEISHPRVVPVPAEGDRTAIWAEVESALSARPPGLELVIGIDPGPRPGYAVLEGGVCIAQGNLSAPEETAGLAGHLGRRFPHRSIVFRVGSGERLSRDRILNALVPLQRPIEVVDEQGTTPRGRRRPRDGDAARAIGRNRGRPVRTRSSLRITPGEISNLQRLSREHSGGRFTLPRGVAERVLRGDETMNDAMADAALRYGGPPRAPPRDRWPSEPS